MGFLIKRVFLLPLFILFSISGCKYTDNLLGDVPSIDASHSPSISSEPENGPFTIFGPVAVGEVLGVSDYGNVYSASSSHQWLSNEVAIAGATATTFTVTAAEEGTTMTLSIDGQPSSNSLITEYFAILAHENKSFQVTGNLNGFAMVYDNLAYANDLGAGVLQFLAGPNSNYRKRASSTEVIKNVGDYFEFTNGNVTGYSGYIISWSPVATEAASTKTSRISINRGSNNHVLAINGVSEYIGGGTSGTYRVTRTATGFEISRNNVVLYAD